MADKISKPHRSWLMSRIRSRHTKPERIVRSLLHRLGYRFTVNGPLNKKLPGKPDIVLPKHKTAVFVHGCFWHRHPNCKSATTPKSNVEYWETKFARNVERDRDNVANLEKSGWLVITIWECELKNLETISASLIAKLPRAQHFETPEELEDQLLVAETQRRYGK